MSTGDVSQSRITVSEDKLDAKLARLELNLVDRITSALETKADQAYVEQLHARVHSVESVASAAASLAQANIEKDADKEKRIRALERFKNAVPSVAAISLVVSIATAVVAYIH